VALAAVSRDGHAIRYVADCLKEDPMFAPFVKPWHHG
jgi:hypothetical protein